MFLNYLGVKRSSGKFWTVSEALKNMTVSNLAWFSPVSGVRRVASFYRNLVPSSAELERLMSYFRLLDTPLTQARTPDTVSKMLMLLKDSPNPDRFDLDLAITIWKHLKVASSVEDEGPESIGRRFVYFPDPPVLPTPGKFTVKPFQDLLEERIISKARKEALRKKLAQVNTDDQDQELVSSLVLIEQLEDVLEDVDAAVNLEDLDMVLSDEIDL